MTDAARDDAEPTRHGIHETQQAWQPLLRLRTKSA
jgi:hypothetical protein